MHTHAAGAFVEDLNVGVERLTDEKVLRFNNSAFAFDFLRIYVL